MDTPNLHKHTTFDSREMCSARNNILYYKIKFFFPMNLELGCVWVCVFFGICMCIHRTFTLFQRINIIEMMESMRAKFVWISKYHSLYGLDSCAPKIYLIWFFLRFRLVCMGFLFENLAIYFYRSVCLFSKHKLISDFIYRNWLNIGIDR